MVMLIMIMTGMNDSSINDNVISLMPFSKYIENDRFNNCDIEIKMDNMMKMVIVQNKVILIMKLTIMKNSILII